MISHKDKLFKRTRIWFLENMFFYRVLYLSFNGYLDYHNSLCLGAGWLTQQMKRKKIPLLLYEMLKNFPLLLYIIIYLPS
jgi:hypothetical protein